MQGDKIKALIGKYINQLGKDKLVEEALQELNNISEKFDNAVESNVGLQNKLFEANNKIEDLQENSDNLEFAIQDLCFDIFRKKDFEFNDELDELNNVAELISEYVDFAQFKIEEDSKYIELGKAVEKWFEYQPTKDRKPSLEAIREYEDGHYYADDYKESLEDLIDWYGKEANNEEV